MQRLRSSSGNGIIGCERLKRVVRGHIYGNDMRKSRRRGIPWLLGHRTAHRWDEGERTRTTSPSLVTQPMLQQRPNRTELRSLDSYIQILSRFQKCKQKVPPPSLLNNEKSPFTLQRKIFLILWGWRNFLARHGLRPFSRTSRCRCACTHVRTSHLRWSHFTPAHRTPFVN